MKLARKLSLATAGAFIGFAGVVISSVAPASAFTITTGGTSLAGEGQISSVANTTTVNFNGGSAPTTGYANYSSASGSPAIVSGTVSSNYAAPAADASKYLTIAPVGSGAAGSNSPITIALSKAADYFGLYWGSVDTYNIVKFFNGATLLASYTGADVPGTTASGNQSSAQDNVYVNFFAGTGEAFNRIELSTTSIAFESDNHAFREVPEPLTIGGSALALGFGWMMKRKKALAS
ncbi:MAG: PEP-CTERM sorting domain-containing protein [Aulosira sp. DedQUE10]|nr:PEP-CTERM sorting domain-containing protein [Aulosira sp. DedQUE10]